MRTVCKRLLLCSLFVLISVPLGAEECREFCREQRKIAYQSLKEKRNKGIQALFKAMDWKAEDYPHIARRVRKMLSKKMREKVRWQYVECKRICRKEGDTKAIRAFSSDL